MAGNDCNLFKKKFGSTQIASQQMKWVYKIHNNKESVELQKNSIL